MVRIALAIVGILFGVGLAVTGGVALWAEQASGALFNEAEGRAPGTVTFAAEDRDYTVHLGSGARSGLQNDTRCTVTRANESVVELRGDRGGVSVGERTVGTFRGLAGTTRVQCAFVERNLQRASARFYVAPQREWLRTAGFVLIGLGVVGILLSTLLLLSGIRSRRPADQLT